MYGDLARVSPSLLASINKISPAHRAGLKHQKPLVLWMTGRPGAGKSTLSEALEKSLHSDGFHTVSLDGDALRTGLTSDLGFSHSDRTENVRRVGEVTRLMFDAGLIVIVALVSPFAADRNKVRSLFPHGDFIEIFVDTPIGLAEHRDPKGLYRSARAGKITEFTGIDSAYEAPVDAEIKLTTQGMTPAQTLQELLQKLHILTPTLNRL
jgi:adenylylsulfate kinase